VDRPGIPGNCTFTVANLNDGLKFDNDSMDLVHSRLLYSKNFVTLEQSNYGINDEAAMANLYEGGLSHSQTWCRMGSMRRF
jgi:hypothetical protein